MARNEKDDYKIFKNNVPDALDRVDRVENIVAVGMPDINFCAEGAECWIELKSPKEPARESTPLFGSNHKLSTYQANWFLSQKNADGNGYILIATDKRWVLIDGKKADFVNSATVFELIEMSSWAANKPISKQEFKNLRSTLIGK